MLFISHQISAQKIFNPGYIILKGDTIKGLVSDEGVIKSGKIVTFKDSDDAVATDYSPSEIDGYGATDGSRYMKLQLGVGDTATTAFFRILVLGTNSLYSLRDDQGNVHYYFSKRTDLQELIRTTFTKKLPNRKKAIFVNEPFRALLAYLTKDCPEVSALAPTVLFKEKALTALVLKYNSCSSTSQVTYEGSVIKFFIIWGLVAGGSNINLVVANHPTDALNGSYASSMSPFGGLFINTTLPWISRKFSAQLEALYSKHSFSNVRHDVEGFRNNEYTVDIKLQYLKVPLIVRYKIPVGKVSPFMNIGVAYAFSTKHTQRMHITSTTTSGNVTEQDRFFMQLYNPIKNPTDGYIEAFRTISQSVLVGGGVEINAWSGHPIYLEARYEVGNGFSSISAISTTLKQYALMASFAF